MKNKPELNIQKLDEHPGTYVALVSIDEIIDILSEYHEVKYAMRSYEMPVVFIVKREDLTFGYMPFGGFDDWEKILSDEYRNGIIKQKTAEYRKRPDVMHKDSIDRAKKLNRQSVIFRGIAQLIADSERQFGSDRT